MMVLPDVRHQSSGYLDDSERGYRDLPMLTEYDEIQYWSEVKLDIVKEYAAAYSHIMAAQSFSRGHFYIDAFAGAGLNLSMRTGEFVLGSPLNALCVERAA